MTNNTEISQAERYTKVRQVLLWVLAANIAVTLVKIILGLVTGALAVVADGFHSMVDSSSNLIGLAAIRLAQRPADDHHPYGYRRYETLGAMAIGGLLLVAAYKIGSAVIERFSTSTVPDITPLSFWLVVLTFPINLVVVILEKRAGQKLGSEILTADARHTQTDLYVTASVVLSLIGVQLGWTWLDQVVAAFVVVMILRAAYQILRETTSWLTDSVVINPEDIERVAHAAPGVRFVHNIRSRGTPDAAFVDLHVKVDPGMSTSQAHAIANEIEHQLVKQINGVTDAMVHIEPSSGINLTPWERLNHDLRSIADGMGLGLHDLHIHADENGEYIIELHLEMQGNLSLVRAHELADKFEKTVKQRWPQARQVLTHLEPIPSQMLLPGEHADPELLEKIRAIVAEHLRGGHLLDAKIFSSGGHLHTSIQFSMPIEASLAEAHQVSEQIETELLKQLPELSRVTLHAEPEI